MVVSQGEIGWADLPEPSGSGPGFRRPVLVVQGDGLNYSRIATNVVVPRVRSIPATTLGEVLAGIDVVLGR